MAAYNPPHCQREHVLPAVLRREYKRYAVRLIYIIDPPEHIAYGYPDVDMWRYAQLFSMPGMVKVGHAGKHFGK